MCAVTLKLDEVLERLGVTLAQLKEVWNSGGAVAIDWLHAESDGERNCSASIQLGGGDPRRMEFNFEAGDFLSGLEDLEAVDVVSFGRLVLLEGSGQVEVKGSFEDFCGIVAKVQGNPAFYETGVAICAALVIAEDTD